MSDDEEDYMSEQFIIDSVKQAPPSLVKNRGVQRELEVEKKKRRIDAEHRTKGRSQAQLEEERRVEGMSVSISSENKGFAMLAKMGYKSGQPIGKLNGNGIVEPIAIQVKSDRGGLGREAALKQLQEKRLEIRAKQLQRLTSEPTTTEEFRKRMTQQVKERQIEADLGKCQRACEKLDQQESIDNPAMEWFWPLRKTEDTAEEAASSSDSEESQPENDEIIYKPADKLDMLTDYLRTTYCFCHWCGTQYDGISDLKENCPGEKLDDH